MNLDLVFLATGVPLPHPKIGRPGPAKLEEFIGTMLWWPHCEIYRILDFLQEAMGAIESLFEKENDISVFLKAFPGLRMVPGLEEDKAGNRETYGKL